MPTWNGVLGMSSGDSIGIFMFAGTTSYRFFVRAGMAPPRECGAGGGVDADDDADGVDDDDDAADGGIDGEEETVEADVAEPSPAAMPEVRVEAESDDWPVPVAVVVVVVVVLAAWAVPGSDPDFVDVGPVEEIPLAVKGYTRDDDRHDAAVARTAPTPALRAGVRYRKMERDIGNRFLQSRSQVAIKA